ncbi:MAG: hypothetical protein F6K24_14475 [Okeania sp. SIO2D1]|nr:hypothetical protein [Okeania sp. SIO2D1]
MPLLKVPAAIAPWGDYPSAVQPQVKIALARDRAFSFYYQDNLELLEQLGATLIPWSPLVDKKLPKGVRGIYLGGGFPEVFAQNLAANYPARQAVKNAIQQGMPTYAECGGLMYLCENIVDFTGDVWPMVGILPTNTLMSKNLVIGYRQAIALHNTPITQLGQTVWGHEFHHSELTRLSPKPLWNIKGIKHSQPHQFTHGEGWQRGNLHASYIHLHFGTNTTSLQRFLNCCRMFTNSRSPDQYL